MAETPHLSKRIWSEPLSGSERDLIEQRCNAPGHTYQDIPKWLRFMLSVYDLHTAVLRAEAERLRELIESHGDDEMRRQLELSDIAAREALEAVG